MTHSQKLALKPLGQTLSAFLAISFILCILWGLIMPERFHMHPAWQAWLPGFSFSEPITWLLGLTEAYLYGWYIALVYVPLRNFFIKGATS